MAEISTDSQEAPAITASDAVPAHAPESQAAPVVAEVTTETKPVEGDAAAKEAADKAAVEAAARTPVEYDIKLPEGAIKGELLEDLKAFAKEKGLTNEDAQKLADLGVKQSQGFVAQLAEAQKTQTAEWAAATTADKDIGGDKLPENLATAKKALDNFGTPEFKKLLNDSGLGNHPEIVRFMVKAGKAISEDGRLVTGSAAQTDRQNLPIEERIYGKNKG